MPISSGVCSLQPSFLYKTGSTLRSSVCLAASVRQNFPILPVAESCLGVPPGFNYVHQVTINSDDVAEVLGVIDRLLTHETQNLCLEDMIRNMDADNRQRPAPLRKGDLLPRFQEVVFSFVREHVDQLEALTKSDNVAKVLTPADMMLINESRRLCVGGIICNMDTKPGLILTPRMIVPRFQDAVFAFIREHVNQLEAITASSDDEADVQLMGKAQDHTRTRTRTTYYIQRTACAWQRLCNPTMSQDQGT